MVLEIEGVPIGGGRGDQGVTFPGIAFTQSGKFPKTYNPMTPRQKKSLNYVPPRVRHGSHLHGMEQAGKAGVRESPRKMTPGRRRVLKIKKKLKKTRNQRMNIISEWL